MKLTYQTSTCARKCQFRAAGRPGPGKLICRITNTKEEIGEIDKRIRLQHPPDRGGVPLHQTVDADVFEATADDSISLADMDYWFADEEVRQDTFLEPSEEIETVDFTVRNFGLRRAPISTIHEGQELTAEVSTLHLLHGAVVDLGLEWDGLIPINQFQWANPDVLTAVNLDMQVKVRVHKIRDYDIYRFPIQLELLEPDLSAYLTPPHEWRAPIEIRKDTDVLKLLEMARPDYVPLKVDIKNPTIGTPEEMEVVAHEERFGATAPMPAQPRQNRDGQIFMDYETWRATQIASQYF